MFARLYGFIDADSLFHVNNKQYVNKNKSNAIKKMIEKVRRI